MAENDKSVISLAFIVSVFVEETMPLSERLYNDNKLCFSL